MLILKQSPPSEIKLTVEVTEDDLKVAAKIDRKMESDELLSTMLKHPPKEMPMHQKVHKARPVLRMIETKDEAPIRPIKYRPKLTMN